VGFPAIGIGTMVHDGFGSAEVFHENHRQTNEISLAIPVSAPNRLIGR